MCGILGVWNLDDEPVSLVALSRGARALRHRGPDSEGYLLVNSRSGDVVPAGGPLTPTELGLPMLETVTGGYDLVLGFRRLAILDLSPAGHQPMSSPDGRYWIVFNGEVYNYLELREELRGAGYSFHTGTDTEVILAAYSRWGPECLRRFNGMWGLAIWDNDKRSLFIARDRFGVKPFYTVQTTGKRFAFASEQKALFALGAVEPRPAPDAMMNYLSQGRFPSHLAGDTFFEGVRALPAAHWALTRKTSYAEQRYWQLSPGVPNEQDAPQDAARNFRELFVDSVRLRLRSDVPVATCLSGGLDSSAIVAVGGKLMREEHAVSLEMLGERQQTFSAVYDTPGPWNERPHIETVLRATGASGNFVMPTAAGLLGDVECLVRQQDEPFQSTSIFAQWCVMRLAKSRGVTVLLDGQGADEALGGYRPFATVLSGALRRGRLLDFVRLGGAIRKTTGLNPIPLALRAAALQLPESALRRLEARRRHRAEDRALLHEHSTERVRDASGGYTGLRELSGHLMRLLVEDSLPNLLRYEDRNSMAFSIEARVPFLDYRLVEYVFQRAERWRIHDGWTKWIEREATRDLLPPEIIWRRDKVGFETPERAWLRDLTPSLREFVAGSSKASRYFDTTLASNRIPQLLEEPGGPEQVWRWTNLALWLDSSSGSSDEIAA